MRSCQPTLESAPLRRDSSSTEWTLPANPCFADALRSGYRLLSPNPWRRAVVRRRTGPAAVWEERRGNERWANQCAEVHGLASDVPPVDRSRWVAGSSESRVQTE